MGDKMNKKEIMNELYDALMVTVGVAGLSMVSEKVFKEKLTDATDFRDIAKFTASVAGSTFLVKWLQNKKYIPTDPFKGN